MLQTVLKIIKWISLPVLLTASLLSRFAASYELLVNLVICLGAIILVERSARSKEYYWAAGFTGIAVVFSPLLLVDKIFLLLGFTCIVTSLTLFAAFRMQPLPARHP